MEKLCFRPKCNNVDIKLEKFTEILNDVESAL